MNKEILERFKSIAEGEKRLHDEGITDSIMGGLNLYTRFGSIEKIIEYLDNIRKGLCSHI